MTGSDERTAALLRGPRTESRGAGRVLFWFSGLLGLATIGILPATCAQAQGFPYPWRYPYYDGYPPPLPPGQVAAGEAGPQGYGPDAAYGALPVAEIRRRVALLGFHLIATPRRKDRIYLAEVEDVHGQRHRIVFDAFEGRVIENTKLATAPKKAAVKLAEPDAAAATEKKDVTKPPEKQADDKPSAPPAAKPAQDQ